MAKRKLSQRLNILNNGGIVKDSRGVVYRALHHGRRGGVTLMRVSSPAYIIRKEAKYNAIHS